VTFASILSGKVPQSEADPGRELHFAAVCAHCNGSGPQGVSEDTAIGLALSAGWRMRITGELPPDFERLAELAASCDLLCKRCHQLEFAPL